MKSVCFSFGKGFGFGSAKHDHKRQTNTHILSKRHFLRPYLAANDFKNGDPTMSPQGYDAKKIPNDKFKDELVIPNFSPT